MKNFKLLFLLFLMTFVGCVNTSNYSKDHTLIINFTQNNPDLTIDDVKINVGSVVYSEEYLKLKIEAVNGGSNYFLGYKFKEVHGDTYKGRVKVKCKNEIVELSVNQILNWQSFSKDSLKIYIAPRL